MSKQRFHKNSIEELGENKYQVGDSIILENNDVLVIREAVDDIYYPGSWSLFCDDGKNKCYFQKYCRDHNRLKPCKGSDKVVFILINDD